MRAPPEIQLMNHTRFAQLCYDYAFGKIFKTYSAPTFVYTMPTNDWIEKYFSVTNDPQKGDLVCYYKQGDLSNPVHYGVYDSPDLVESKWGNNPVYKHPPFYVTNNYGQFIRYYRLPPEGQLKAYKNSIPQPL